MNKIDKPYVYKVIEKDTGKFYIGKKVAKNKSGEKDISYVVRDFTKEKINSVLSIKSHEELKSVSSITAAII